jgi:hypothetical protein
MARFPGLKVVFIARDPVERLWSALAMAARQANSRIPLPVTPKSVLTFAERKDVKTRSYPSQIISRWRECVPDGQFEYYFFDDLRHDAPGLRRRVLRFLDADPDLPSGDLPPGFNRKSSAAKITLSDDVRDALVHHFADEIRTCAVEFGGPANEWRRKYGL